MLPSILLFLEVFLLAATVYTYWLTRRLGPATGADRTRQHNQAEETERSATISDMARDVIDLMAELQDVASAARNDLTRQSADLQEHVNQAHLTITKLQELINRAEASTRRPANNVPRTLTEALQHFRAQLEADGCKPSQVKTMMSHMHAFAVWLGGQHFENISLSHVTEAQIEDYFYYLRCQNNHADTIQPKIATLELFIQWVDILLDAGVQTGLKNLERRSSGAGNPALVGGQKPAARGDKAVIVPISATPTSTTLANIERYRLVFTLAEQGLKQPDIAARTGLEREAIRMLLTNGAPSQFDH